MFVARIRPAGMSHERATPLPGKCGVRAAEHANKVFADRLGSFDAAAGA
jgi:hypothetical protein